MCIKHEEFFELKSDVKHVIKELSMHIRNEAQERESMMQSIDRLSNRIWTLAIIAMTSILGMAGAAMGYVFVFK